MKIIGFNASPRNNGNTAWTINKILEGANAHGAKTSLFNTSELVIKPCRGCLGCHSDKNAHGCVINDDMQKLYAALEESAAMVLGSPIYMGQMSGQTKVFIDRLFAQISPRFSPHYKEKNAGKKLILVFTQGNPKLDMFQTYYDYTKRMFEILEFDVKEVLVVGGTRVEQARDKAELPPLLKKIGASLVLD
ncbi:MAG: flavodoxin family protein [Clostridiales bacterium]|jgi:multimeric flavodoxin WrbA|nr:flavodoxin family protein [Clostridiales bacterium]